MCLAIPGRVVEFLDEGRQMAKVDVSGVRRSVHVGLLGVDGLEVGDWVLIHVGFALSRIDEAEARATHDWLSALGDLYVQELEEMRRGEEEGV